MRPTPRFAVLVETYRISPTVGTGSFGLIYYSLHNSPRQAARRLASTITGTAKGMDLRPADMATRHVIRDHKDWTTYSLTDFRKFYCQ